MTVRDAKQTEASLAEATRLIAPLNIEAYLKWLDRTERATLKETGSQYHHALTLWRMRWLAAMARGAQVMVRAARELDYIREKKETSKAQDGNA